MPSARSAPQRTCVACRRTRPKRELVRLVRTESGEVLVDSSGKANGRGAYLCPEVDCWTLAERRKAVSRALGVGLDAGAWQNLLTSRPTKEV